MYILFLNVKNIKKNILKCSFEALECLLLSKVSEVNFLVLFYNSQPLYPLFPGKTCPSPVCNVEENIKQFI